MSPACVLHAQNACGNRQPAECFGAHLTAPVLYRATVAEAMTLTVPVDEEVMQNINLGTHAIIVHEYLLSPARHVAAARVAFATQLLPGHAYDAMSRDASCSNTCSTCSTRSTRSTCRSARCMCLWCHHTGCPYTNVAIPCSTCELTQNESCLTTGAFAWSAGCERSTPLQSQRQKEAEEE